MGLNEVDKYFFKDSELQNYTKTGVKRIINPFIFQNIFQFSPLRWERSGSVVECLTRDRRAAGSSLTGVTVLCP